MYRTSIRPLGSIPLFQIMEVIFIGFCGFALHPTHLWSIWPTMGKNRYRFLVQGLATFVQALGQLHA